MTIRDILFSLVYYGHSAHHTDICEEAIREHLDPDRAERLLRRMNDQDNRDQWVAARRRLIAAQERLFYAHADRCPEAIETARAEHLERCVTHGDQVTRGAA